MKRFGATALALVATGIVAIYTAQAPSEGQHGSSVVSDPPVSLYQATPPGDSPEGVPTLAPPQPTAEPAPSLAVLDLPEESRAQTQVIYVPVEVERIAAEPSPASNH